MNSSHLSGKGFDETSTGLVVSFHFAGEPNAEVLQLPDGADGEGSHGAYAA